MNWFERYGVVGALFLIMVIFWLCSILSFTMNAVNNENNKCVATAIAILFTISILPFVSKDMKIYYLTYYDINGNIQSKINF